MVRFDPKVFARCTRSPSSVPTYPIGLGFAADKREAAAIGLQRAGTELVIAFVQRARLSNRSELEALAQAVRSNGGQVTSRRPLPESIAEWVIEVFEPARDARPGELEKVLRSLRGCDRELDATLSMSARGSVLFSAVTNAVRDLERREDERDEPANPDPFVSRFLASELPR